jgi:hypothetical protein
MKAGEYLIEAGQLVKLLCFANPLIALLFYVGVSYLHSSVVANLMVCTLITGFNVFNLYRIGTYLIKAGKELQ